MAPLNQCASLLARIGECRHGFARRMVLWLAVWICWTYVAAEPNSQAPANPNPASDELVQIQKEVQQLKEEIALLRKENQQLRRLLAERATTLMATNAVTAVLTPPTNQTASAKDTGLTHWLTSGGKRHNRECRYFEKAGGRPCTPHEGTACKICGG